MKILSFAEGANPRAGGMGLVGIPWICQSLADQGHRVILNLGGITTPGSEQFVRSSGDESPLTNSARSFDIITYPSYGKWAFAPSMLRQLYRLPKDVDFIMLHSLYSFPVLVGYTLARLNKKPYGFWPHGVLAPVQRGVSAGKKRLYDRLVGRSVMDDASVILYSSVGERDQTAPLNLRSPSVVIPHGIELNIYKELPARGQFRQRYFGGYEGPLVLCLGRLNAKKGLDLLAASMARVVSSMPDVRLAIVGGSDPPDFVNQVKNWLSNHGVEQNTVLTGFLSEPEKLSALADADVFVSPSHAENFGFAMFEAMACGVPVVVSKTLDYAPEVGRYGAGLAVPREASEFAAAILSLLEDEQYRRRLGENGKELAKSYGWQSCAEQLERTIQNILSDRPL